MKEIKMMGEECLRCGHVWVPNKKTVKPITCPKCKSPYWYMEREKKKDKEVRVKL